MEIGDTLKGRITSSGCFFAHYEYAFELARVAKHPGWELELEQTVTSYGKALPGKRTMPLTILDIVDLDWELQYARLQTSADDSTNAISYSLTLSRGGQILQQEEICDSSGGYFNRGNTTFIGLLNSQD